MSNVLKCHFFIIVKVDINAVILNERSLYLRRFNESREQHKLTARAAHVKI